MDIHLAPATYTTNEANAWVCGYQRAYNDARQLWPEPITDRPPSESDADDLGKIQVLDQMQWATIPWHLSYYKTGLFSGWLHTPRWKPKQPTLQEQALEVLAGLEKRCDLHCDIRLIRRALEQAGEAQQ